VVFSVADCQACAYKDRASWAVPAISQLARQLNDLDLTPEQNKQIVVRICQSVDSRAAAQPPLCSAASCLLTVCRCVVQ
jgi:hypothetical protein